MWTLFAKHSLTVDVYRDAGGFWRWRAVQPENKQTVCTSGEAFDSKSNAERAARALTETRFSFGVKP